MKEQFLYKMKRTVVFIWRPLLLIADHTQRRSKKRKKCAVYEKIIEELFANEEVI